jgi:hypothetical protein
MAKTALQRLIIGVGLYDSWVSGVYVETPRGVEDNSESRAISTNTYGKEISL